MEYLQFSYLSSTKSLKIVIFNFKSSPQLEIHYEKPLETFKLICVMADFRCQKIKESKARKKWTLKTNTANTNQYMLLKLEAEELFEKI